MSNLWEYLTNVAKSMPVGAEGLAKLATEPARFTANGATSVYDSFKRGMQPTAFGEDPYLRQQQDIGDAFNVAGGTMTGSMPFAPKGPGTLGTFKLPSDVVTTVRGQNIPGSLTAFSPDTVALHNLVSRYQDKQWGTMKDPVIAHIDKGYRVPNVPGLEANLLNSDLEMFQGLGRRLPKVLAKMEQTTRLPLQGTTDLGRAVEIARDRRMRGEDSLPTSVIASYSRGMSQKTKDYLKANPEARAFARPNTSPFDIEKMPYKVAGNLDRMSMEDYLMKASEQEAAIANAKIPDEQLHTFDDGHYWTQLKTQVQREAESEAMGNSTRLPMHDSKDLYSLRDKNGKSILTASRHPGHPKFDEIKTRFNETDILDLLRNSGKGARLIDLYPHVKALKDNLGIDGESW